MTDTASFSNARLLRLPAHGAPFAHLFPPGCAMLGSVQHQDMTAVACCMLACLATAELLRKEAHAVQPCMGLRPDTAADG